MARPITMMSVALATAAISGLAPQLMPPPGLARAPNVVILSSTQVTGTPATPPSGPSGILMTGEFSGFAGQLSGAASGIKIIWPGRSALTLPLERRWLNQEASTRILLRNDMPFPLQVHLDVTAQDRNGKALTAALNKHF